MQVPRHRNLPFKTLLFENYKRSETALITTMAEMVANGVATRKVERIRSKSIGMFSNTDSLLRMMGSLLIELNDNLQLKKIIFQT